MADLRNAAQQALKALVARAERGDGAPETVAALRAALAQEKQEPVPYAWHYWNIGGGSTWHRGPSKRLDADTAAAKEYPRAHHLTPLYTSPPDHLAVMRQALEALEERYVGALRDSALDALRAALEGER